jgi:hypothetical protein
MERRFGSWPVAEHTAPPALACRPRTPRAPQPEHQRADRSQRVAVERAEIDGPAGPAARFQNRPSA